MTDLSVDQTGEASSSSTSGVSCPQISLQESFAWIFIWTAKAERIGLFDESSQFSLMNRIEYYMFEVKYLTRYPKDLNKISTEFVQDKTNFVKFLAKSEGVDISQINHQNHLLLIEIVEIILTFVDSNLNEKCCLDAVHSLLQFIYSSADNERIKRFFNSLIYCLFHIPGGSEFSREEFIQKLIGYYWPYSAKEINRNFSKVVNKKELEVFVKLCDHCKQDERPNRIFIHVAAPSYSGKTQMSISLDSYSEYPLIGPKNPEAPFLLLLRCSVATLIENYCGDVTCQEYVNCCVFDDFIRVTIREDYKKLEDAFVAEYPEQDKNLASSISRIVSGSHIASTFSASKSNLLSLFLFWIQSRINGSDQKSFKGALKEKYLYLRGFVPPLTVEEFKKQVQELNPLNKAIVVVLDDFKMSKFEKETGWPLMLRNFLRVMGFSVITMGPNSRSPTLTEDIPAGADEGSAPLVHIVTNVFSTAVIIETSVLTDTGRIEYLPLLIPYKDKEWFKVIQSWILKSPCLRPGILELFLH